MYTRKWVRTVVVWVRVCDCMRERARARAQAQESESETVCVRGRASRKERRGKTRRLGGEEGVERQGLKVVGITQVG